MFSPFSVTLVVLLYMAILFAIAQFVEQRFATGRHLRGPWIYALSMAVYATSWSFYGSVGLANQSGLMYLGIYIGALLAIACWWLLLRRMVAVKETFHITSIADFISTRYNRSQLIAALVTLIALIGALPYIALQLKAIVSSFNLITAGSERGIGSLTGLLTTVMMIAFTILFGARRLDPTERHPGMITALAVQCLIKLIAFLAVGLFVTFAIFGGLDAVGERLLHGDLQDLSSLGGRYDDRLTWLTFIVLSFIGIQLLPRQFHVAVVENADQNHIKTAMWLFPLYIVLINLFVLPIAGAGRISGLPPALADYYVLLVPQQAGQTWLTLLVFLGGFSAAAAMVLVTTMTLATMASNHLLLPLLERLPGLGRTRRFLLQIRWGLIALILGSGYWFAVEFADSYILVTIGLMSFAAIAQFAPALFGGMFWRRGNSAGAAAGLAGGFLVWCHTLALPTFVRAGLAAPSILSEGPWSISALRPEALFGVEGIPPLTHSVLWSLTVNTGLYILVSLLYRPHKRERTLAYEFLTAMRIRNPHYHSRATGLEAYIELEPKLAEATSLLAKYLSEEKAADAIAGIAAELEIDDKPLLTIIELIEFHRMLEHVLAGAIGAASAHGAVETSIRYGEREASDLKALYSHLISELNGQRLPDLGTARAPTEPPQYGMIESLQRRIEEQQGRLQEQQTQIDELEGKLEERYQEIFRYRIQAQKLQQENEQLRTSLHEESHRTAAGNSGRAG